MWNKIYSLLLIVSVVVISIIAFLDYFNLQSKGFSTATIAASYDSYANTYWVFLGISFLVLLAVGNVILWLFRNSWALWASFAYFVVFTLIKSFLLDSLLFAYEVEKSLPQSSKFASYVVGVLICGAVGAVVFFNQFLVMRMRDKIHGEPTLIKEQNEMLLTEKNDSTESTTPQVGEESRTTDDRTN